MEHALALTTLLHLIWIHAFRSPTSSSIFRSSPTFAIRQSCRWAMNCSSQWFQLFTRAESRFPTIWSCTKWVVCALYWEQLKMVKMRSIEKKKRKWCECALLRKTENDTNTLHWEKWNWCECASLRMVQMRSIKETWTWWKSALLRKNENRTNAVYREWYKCALLRKIKIMQMHSIEKNWIGANALHGEWRKCAPLRKNEKCANALYWETFSNLK